MTFPKAQIMPYFVFFRSKSAQTIQLFLFLLLLFSLVSCSRRPHYQANISGVEIEPIEIKRYEKVLFALNPMNIRESIEPYLEDYYLFLGEEIETQMGQQQLYDYITDPNVLELFEDVQEIWPSLEPIESELTRAFRYFHFHFPDLTIPQIFTYVSGLNFEEPIFYQDSLVVVALDMFLGRDYENYNKVGIPAFKRVRFSPEALSVEIMREIGRYIHNRSALPPESLLDFMLTEGKILYFLDAMFPQKPDSLKIYYTGLQLDWAQRNEAQSWAFILNNEMLYSTDRQLIQKFIGDTPFTAPFSAGSAPRMAVFNGWQIVREYMRRNPEMSIEDLFGYTNSREILRGSRYRP